MATTSKTTSAASRKHAAAPLTPWEKATRGRERLEAMPLASRTKADYAKVLDDYRMIYHSDPQSKYAPPAVNAVAELLTSQGHELNDTKSLKDAVGQYEFLRKQYPGSSLRVSALLAEGQLYENDLGDPASAKQCYQQLLKQYPKSEQTEEARAGLESLQRRASGSSAKSATAKGERRGTNTQSITRASAAENRVVAPVPVRAPDTKPADDGAARKGVSAAEDVISDARETAPSNAPQPSSAPQPGVTHVAATSGAKHGELAQVTGIRHWSTPNYTRVAIDLGDDVTYEAARVPNPDRIYFDLHGTRLAQSLAGKSFAVTDDGFLKRIRAAQFSNNMTRVVLDVNDVTEYSAFLLPNPYRLIIDIHGNGQPPQHVASGNSVPPPSSSQGETAVAPPPTTAPDEKTSSHRPVPNSVATNNAGTTSEVAEVSDQPGREDATSTPTSQPIAAVVPGSRPATTAPSTRKSRRSKEPVDPATPARAAAPTADGQTSLVRALGLKIGRIVIDAGHGGHDSGTLGVDGIQEKDVVLDVALRLGKLLHERLGAEIIYTRSDDTFIPLETRTAIANKSQADLFLSIHANSSSDSTARGVETYYLNFTSQADALEVAARENAVSDQSIYQLSDLVKKIALKDKIDESREFASDVEANLYAGLERGNAGLKNRGVKKAPFVVLIGANMPSVLAEISFVTNPKDAEQLREPEYRQRVAESLYKGVAKYEGGLSGSRTSVERASTSR
ncbi:MAG: N-acetylmuramoyl-L-alanine amidase [Edaphobacter sp.]|uniref:N-acetylmuramoyl-L-alanine amidase n=1 Tax=Edaphobacter sp. TaxID=1934404 RepID=UPI00239DC5ED|nr:N-acetylmuramoyl-L-alanine amidase [Edaphobacter sp.]MDE1177992.1 N-acetylmuramoyl-L-alanine amidase [Edaphobacter sp.]